MDAGIDRYDDKYRRAHYFRYRQWLYRPFVEALVNKANLRAGCRVLDVGCGQGFFVRRLRIEADWC
jgi:protein-L-isoaspartate O-methyltransferase